MNSILDFYDSSCQSQWRRGFDVDYQHYSPKLQPSILARSATLNDLLCLECEAYFVVDETCLYTSTVKMKHHCGIMHIGCTLTLCPSPKSMQDGLVMDLSIYWKPGTPSVSCLPVVHEFLRD